MYKQYKLNNGLYKKDFEKIKEAGPQTVIQRLGQLKKSTSFYLYKKDNSVILYSHYISRKLGSKRKHHFGFLSTNQVTLLKKGFSKADQDELDSLVEKNKYQEIFDYFLNLNNGEFDMIFIINEDEDAKEPIED